MLMCFTTLSSLTLNNLGLKMLAYEVKGKVRKKNIQKPVYQKLGVLLNNDFTHLVDMY